MLNIFILIKYNYYYYSIFNGYNISNMKYNIIYEK